MDRKALGRRVSSARKSRGMTGEVLAEKCNINVTDLRQIEGGTKIPSLPMFARMCQELRVSPNYLLSQIVPGTEAGDIEEIVKFVQNATPAEMHLVREILRAVEESRTE